MKSPRVTLRFRDEDGKIIKAYPLPEANTFLAELSVSIGVLGMLLWWISNMQF